jgi:general stress protein 26
MTDDPKTKDEIQAKLWDEIKHSRFGMLGLADNVRQFQPMAAIPEPGERAIWFFTKSTTDLAKAVADGGSEGVFLIQSKDQELQANILGDLDLIRDAGRVDKYWNPMVAAWFPEGRDDPSLVLLRLSVRSGEVWMSRQGPVRMAWEIAKANATHEEPNLGQRSSLDLGEGSGLPRWR